MRTLAAVVFCVQSPQRIRAYQVRYEIDTIIIDNSNKQAVEETQSRGVRSRGRIVGRYSRVSMPPRGCR
jgi:hypothetical protein